MKRINLVIKVSDGLEIIDRCYNQDINHDMLYDRHICIESSAIKSLANTLSRVSVRAKSWKTQKLAEKCNNAILSHIGYISTTTSGKKFLDVTYPYLQISILGMEQ